MIETYEYILPDWSLSYLINGDGSSLTETEISQLDAFCLEVINECGNACFIFKEEIGFLHQNDFNYEGGNCSLCLIQH